VPQLARVAIASARSAEFALAVRPDAEELHIGGHKPTERFEDF
jgi:hypothetical protein